MSFDDKDCMFMPFFEIVDNIGSGEFRKHNYFDTGTLFWSLSRLFGYYRRIMENIIAYKKTGDREYTYLLDADIETYIIRTRIILNDIAFIIRKMYPENTRKLKNPKGAVHPNNKEMSITDIYNYFTDNPDFHPEMKAVLDQNSDWIFYVKDQRDAIIHYKSKIIIFYPEEISFAFFNPANDQPMETMEDGSTRLVLRPVYSYINDHMISLLRFINIDLVKALSDYIASGKIKATQAGIAGSTRILGSGIPLFNELNPDFKAI